MKKHLHNIKPHLCGFSLPEMLIVLAVIGSIAAIAIPTFSGVNTDLHSKKLNSDVKTINSAINIYRANGGSFSGISDMQEILDKLKTTRNADDAAEFVGYSGSMVEKGLAIRSLQGEEIDGGAPRAVWNAVKNRFEITTKGTGIKEFYLDSARANADYSTEKRDNSVLARNSQDGWVWGYSGDSVVTHQEPTVIPIGTIPNSNPPLPPAPVRLDKPIFSPQGGVFPFSDFPLLVGISNPNPSSTWVQYSTNGGASWNTFTGSISVSPDTEVLAYAEGDPASWINSSTVFAAYSSTLPEPELLAIPPIQLSATEFNDETPVVQITITNPNPSGSSEIRYAIKMPEDSYPPVNNWLVYNGPISVTSDDFPEGFHVQAYAKSLDTVHWTDSGSVEADVGASFIGIPITGDVLLVLDASSSMGEDFNGISRFEMVIQETISAISSLPANRKFNVALFDGGIHWTDGSNILHNATQPKKREIIESLLQIQHGEGTNYEVGLAFAPKFTPMPEMIIFLSDGEPDGNFDYSSELDILIDLGIPVHTIGVDLDEDALDALEEISTATGGTFSQISEGHSDNLGDKLDDKLNP